jgi:protein-S-isoprenylcysteine O-methyltransferase Ste14
MPHFDPIFAIDHIWELLGAVWLAGLAFTKRTLRAQSNNSRWFQMTLALLGFSLLGGSWFRAGWLGTRFLPIAPKLELAGLALTIIGCAFAVWARLTLGSNWSGRATVKDGHELIVRGPYSLTRHPIYSGLLVASLGTALAVAEWRCLLGLALLTIVFIAKIGQEERLMLQAFPEAYPRYQQRVKALIPGLL